MNNFFKKIGIYISNLFPCPIKRTLTKIGRFKFCSNCNAKEGATVLNLWFLLIITQENCLRRLSRVI